MIFNKYFLFFCAGYLTVATAQTDAKADRTGFKRLVSLLNKSFHDSCKVHVAGEGVTTIVPTTSVFCDLPGGYAIMTAAGGTNPIPKDLKICGFGADMESDCKALQFTGTVREDLQKAFAFIHGLPTRRELQEAVEGVRAHQNSHIVGTDYDMLVELLNGVYHNNCKVRVTGLRPSDSLVYFDCNRPGGYASLTAKRAANPVPTKFSACEQGYVLEGKCDSVDLTGETTKDIPAVKKVLGIMN